MTFLRDLKFTLRSLAPVMNMKRIAQAPGISTWSLRIEAKTWELSRRSCPNPDKTSQDRPLTGAGVARVLCVTRSWERA